MTQETSKRKSLYVQLLRLLVIAAVAAVFLFFLLNQICGYILDQYYHTPGYEQWKNAHYVQKLQQYIDEYGLTSRDADALDEWVMEQRIINLRVYKDEMQVFDSDYPDEELWEEDISVNEYDWEVYYSVTFVDGPATVSIMGLYAYQFDTYALLAELVISVGFFLLFVLLGIRTKIEYILKLSDEIEILEGGSLDYRITVRGEDELSALAEGLDSMRRSFKHLIGQEAEIVRENQRIVTEMSHDLRTPVTTILLYTEILKKKKYRDEAQLEEYIDKIDRKAHLMKQLADHLFEYSLVAGETDTALEGPESFEALFYDLLSESCNFLQQRGFRTEFKVEWRDEELQVNMDYMIRIMDNIMSNIIKYGDPESPVVIRSVYVAEMAGFSFSNTVKQREEKVESTCVGIQSIKNMMKKMGGTCLARREGRRFVIEILFPV